MSPTEPTPGLVRNLMEPLPRAARLRSTGSAAVVAVVTLVASTTWAGAAPPPGDLLLASTSEAGAKGNADSFDPTLSADGTKAAFVSVATNLDPGDTDGVHDVYVKNLRTGDISLTSTSDAGVKGNGLSAFPLSLSADGTKVGFSSRATNLDPADTTGELDIYVKNLVTGDIALASTSDTGAKGVGVGDTAGPLSLSADGTKVAFVSDARNFDPADTLVSDPDIYVKNLSTGDIALASTSDAGVKGASPGGYASIVPSLSADGTKVAFESTATNLDPADADDFFDVYVKDLVSGDIVLASTSDAGVNSNFTSFGAALSADGTKVAFTTFATNLDPADVDGNSDVYEKDLVTGDVRLVSTSDLGVNGNGDSFAAAISSDGSRVAFVSIASNLDPADVDATRDVYVKNVSTGDVTLASTSVVGVKGNDHSECACRFSGPGSLALSADGTRVVFQSLATNLDPGDPDASVDVYVKTVAGPPPGTLDPSFGAGGRLTTDFGAQDAAAAGVALENGKVVVAGNTVGNVADFALARYLPDGALDPSFDGDGKVATNFGGFDSALGLAVQPDGKFVAAGLNVDNFALARYKRDGVLDPAFDGDGKLTTDFGGADVAFDVAVQPDAKIVVAGGSSGNFALARYLPDGSLDPGFDGDGKVTTDFGGNEGAVAVALQAGGKIVAAGTSSGDFVLARYNPNGSLDATFDGDGRVTVDFGGFEGAADVAVLAGGEILVAGETQPPGPGLTSFALARLKADGSLDTAAADPFLDAPFGTAGKVVTDFPGVPAGAAAMAVESGGKIVLAGYTGSSLVGSFALARYNANGSLDSGFGLGGRVTTDFTLSSDRASDVAIQPDGAIVAIGTAAQGSPSSDFAIARYVAGPCCAVGGGIGGVGP